jgi:hypothetical protein
MNENAEFYFQSAVLLFLLSAALPLLCVGGCDISQLNFYLLAFTMLGASSLLMTIWGIHELYYPSPTLTLSEITENFINDIPKLILLSIAGIFYWYVSEHSKFQANKYIGMNLFGGKRK